MKWLLTLFTVSHLALLNGQSPPGPPPAPPPKAGFLPIVLVNHSHLGDNEDQRVYLLVIGKNPATNEQVFVQFNSSGIGSLVKAIPANNGKEYSQTLSQFPVTGSTADPARVFYVPEINSAIILFSIDQPLDIPVNDPNNIVQPNFTNPNDPNYNTIFDIFEFNFKLSIFANPTAVSFFSIPLYAFLSTPNEHSAKNAGLFQPQKNIFSQTAQAFKNAKSSEWNKLILSNASTTLRILSPGKGMTAPRPFDINYLDNPAANDNYSYISDIWTGPSSFYRTHPLKLTIPVASQDTYTGVVNGNNTITLTSTNNYQVVFGTPSTTPITTSQNIFGGLPLVISDSSPGAADGVQLSKLFQEAIIAGLVPTADTLSNSYLTNNQNFYYTVNPNLSDAGKTTGPWFDLYSKALHSFGNIYTFAFDEPLWPNVLLSSDTLTPETYLGITIGDLTQPIKTTTTLTASNSIVSIDQAVNFSVAVSDNTEETPTGLVAFSVNGSSNVSVPLINGQATLQTSNLPVGVDKIVATYSGDANFASSTASATVTVLAVSPPQDIRVKQVKDQFAAQTDLINIISWKAPTSGNTPVLYKIYRNRQLTECVADVRKSSPNQENFKYLDHQRKKGQSYTYFIVSVDASGNISLPAEG